MLTYSSTPEQDEKHNRATSLDDRSTSSPANQATMERPSFYLSPFVDVKPRNIHIPPYPPVSPSVKQPISPIPRVPVVTKSTSSYRIDDILSKPDPRPPASVPTAAHYRSYPAPPARRYGYSPNVSFLWSSMLQSQWRERYNGMWHHSY